jgi:DNA-directed RNA polymerase specialized sigma24 family protein
MMELYLEHEFSYRQIAAVMERSEVSVRVAMHRSRNQLKKWLKPEDAHKSAVAAKGL